MKKTNIQKFKLNRWLLSIIAVMAIWGIATTVLSLNLVPGVDAQTRTPRPGTFSWYMQFVTTRKVMSPPIPPNTMVTIPCDGDLLVTRKVNDTTQEVVCYKKTSASTQPTQPPVSATTRPTTASTPAATMNMSSMPNPSPVSGTNQAGWSSHMGQWQPNTKWDTCTKAEHDNYNVTGPDGKTYPTWHGPTHTRADGSKCTFGHEHGADPRTANADKSMPAFGYAAEQMGMVEPHAGFKVAVINKGQSFSEGNYAPANYRVVFHMGTAGTKRFVERFHSFEYDYLASDGTGREFHIAGMGDTGNGTGSTCGSDSNSTQNKGPRDGGKDFSTVGCDDPYEIWNGITFIIKDPGAQFPNEVLQNRLGVLFSFAAFDPITTRDPADNSRLLFSQNYYSPALTADPTSPQGQFQGCQREVYGGPNYFKNRGGSTVFYTDVYGTIKPGPGQGLIKQEVSAVESTTNEIFKFRQDFCGNGIHAPN